MYVKGLVHCKNYSVNYDDNGGTAGSFVSFKINTTDLISGLTKGVLVWASFLFF